MDVWYIQLLQTIFFFLRANPDIEQLYPKVRKWALECNEDGWPQREIAFDANGSVLFCSPNERNTGHWTDMSARQVTKRELEIIEKSEFEKYWSEHA